MSAASGLPRLLRGIEGGGDADPRPARARPRPPGESGRDAGARLLDAIEDSGLRGRGGAHVSTALKLRAVAGRRRRAVVVANGSESEPASRKDAVLLTHAPHLVIDGAMVAAAAVGADEVVLYVKRSDPRVVGRGAARRRRAPRGRCRAGRRLRLVAAPDRYVSGQETAAHRAHQRQAGAADERPAAAVRARRRRRPTLVSNVETLAHMALIARHGADWFRALGSPTQPGSVLVTLGGAVARPGVYEIAFGSPLADLLASRRRRQRASAGAAGRRLRRRLARRAAHAAT